MQNTFLKQSLLNSVFILVSKSIIISSVAPEFASGADLCMYDYCMITCEGCMEIQCLKTLIKILEIRKQVKTNIIIHYIKL